MLDCISLWIFEFCLQINTVLCKKIETQLKIYISTLKNDQLKKVNKFKLKSNCVVHEDIKNCTPK